MNNLEFELVIPCYNESESLPTLVELAIQAAHKYRYTSDRFQLVLVNNGSTDTSKLALHDLKQGAQGAWLRIVEVPVNRGYGYGLWQGLQSTTAKYVGWTHADLQCDPLDAFRALEKLKNCRNQNKAIVKGRRIGRNWPASCQSMLAAITASLILKMYLSEATALPKIFHRSFLNCLIDPPLGYQFDVYTMFCAKKRGYEILTMPVFVKPRKYGTSHWAFGLKSRYKAWHDLVRYLLHIKHHP